MLAAGEPPSPSANSTAPYGAVTGVVCNPRRNLHFTIDEGVGSPGALSLVRVIFYHSLRTASARKVLSYPSGKLRERAELVCPACEARVPSPHTDPAHWVQHFDAAVDRARGVAWTCGCT
jgi:hypothetical protein